MSDPSAPFDLEIAEAHDGDRLDRVLAAMCPSISRSTFQRWIDEGRVTIAGAPVISKTRAKAGAKVHVVPAPPPPSDATPQDIPLVVLHEDEHLAVIDKPAGLVVHPAPGHADGTLVNALLFRFGITIDEPASASDDDDAIPTGPPRPGIVHRLDRFTSGVMVVARTPAAREGLTAQFAAHSIERAYLAICEGEHPARATYDTLHGRHPRDRKKFSGKVVRGKRAVTHVERVESLRGTSLVRCRLETGRTHQIRVHLSEHGFPLLGDPLYGRAPHDPFVREVAEKLGGRQALHAAVLGFVHPITKQTLRFETPLPPDLREALEALRSRA
ncbi:RluA family pseudouridine synthase [Sandaracinus amylolyticus]|uniref:RluA family pseudouridine synthase n=1 Tax=Sandaracinus amylolyticus TaxID=927083 RepID=UPI001F01DFC8|nr:RluA family pseudouridine synthase [Sandaracinus amylolyticus]UJR81658.1 Ribosomal large subunit pseudouridine synthase D [Sandaracinus amylolyticus]